MVDSSTAVADFDVLVAPFRRELAAHCYRMTGSLADAEDVLQDALVRAWRGMPSFEGRASLRTWLYRVVTNACLTEIERRGRRALPSDLSEPSDGRTPPQAPRLEAIRLEPCPEAVWRATPSGPEARYSARESVAVAFLAALQVLPPQQRAVLVLRDVLDWSAAEAAELLETSVAAVNSALQRARATLETRRDRLEGVVSLDPDDDRTQALLRRYVDAWDSGDAASLATLLRDDAELTMPPVPTWLRGRDAIASFLGAMLPSMGRFTARAVPVSGGLGVATWLLAAGNERPVAQAIHALASDASGRLSRLDVFMDTSLFARFDLPGSL